MSKPTVKTIPRQFALTNSVNQAEAHFNAGRMDLAEKLYKSILKLLPTHLISNIRLGDIFLKSNQYEQSAIHFKRVVKIQPQQIQYWFQLIHVLQCIGEIEQAYQLVETIAINHLSEVEIQNLEQVLNEPPEYVKKHLINLYQNKDKLISEIATLIHINDYPCAILGWQILGEILHNSDRLQEALELKKRLVCKFPDDANVFVNLSRTQFKLRQFDAALKNARNALILKPEMMEAKNFESLAFNELNKQIIT